jgi:hypothetical protein
MVKGDFKSWLLASATSEDDTQPALRECRNVETP